MGGLRDSGVQRPIDSVAQAGSDWIREPVAKFWANSQLMSYSGTQYNFKTLISN